MFSWIELENFPVIISQLVRIIIYIYFIYGVCLFFSFMHLCSRYEYVSVMWRRKENKNDDEFVNFSTFSST